MKRTTLFLLLVLGGCATSTDAIQASRRFDRQIRWPAEYQPEDASFFVHNEIEIAAPPEAVWDVIVQAETWPDWYEGAQDVDVLGDSPDLSEEAVFTWTTMGLDFTSTIREWVPNERLSWESEKTVIRGYHAWLIVPTATGCVLITDESQNGFLTFFEKIFQPNKLRELHDVWLAKIKERAEANQRSLMTLR